MVICFGPMGQVSGAQAGLSPCAPGADPGALSCLTPLRARHLACGAPPQSPGCSGEGTTTTLLPNFRTHGEPHRPDDEARGPEAAHGPGWLRTPALMSPSLRGSRPLLSAPRKATRVRKRREASRSMPAGTRARAHTRQLSPRSPPPPQETQRTEPASTYRAGGAGQGRLQAASTRRFWLREAGPLPPPQGRDSRARPPPRPAPPRGDSPGGARPGSGRGRQDVSPSARGGARQAPAPAPSPPRPRPLSRYLPSPRPAGEQRTAGWGAGLSLKGTAPGALPALPAARGRGQRH